MDPNPQPAPPKRKMSTTKKLVIGVGGGLVGIVVLVYAGILIYVHVIQKDPPKKLGVATLDSVLDATTTTTSSGSGGTVTAVAAPAGSTATGSGGTSAAGSSAAGVDGTWKASTDSVVGYRVKETLAGVNTEAAGRSSGITGTMTISGSTVSAVDLTVDMTTFSSDQSQRDGQFNGRIMEVSKYPTSTFKLTSPVDIGTIPADGTSVTVKATGDLTMHGTTKSVIFDLTAKETNGRIGVVGSTPITFADYNIDNPSNGFATTGDTGTLEIQLVFDHA
jgi:polyisoprenoid-binding protein YceI